MFAVNRLTIVPHTTRTDRLNCDVERSNVHFRIHDLLGKDRFYYLLYSSRDASNTGAISLFP